MSVCSFASSAAMRRMWASQSFSSTARERSSASAASSRNSVRLTVGLAERSFFFSGAYRSSTFSADCIPLSSVRSVVSSACSGFRIAAASSSESIPAGSCTSTQPRRCNALMSSSRWSRTARMRSFFIFTMDISAVHDPFHDPVGHLGHLPFGLCPHGGLAVSGGGGE